VNRKTWSSGRHDFGAVPRVEATIAETPVVLRSRQFPDGPDLIAAIVLRSTPQFIPRGVSFVLSRTGQARRAAPANKEFASDD
jgi:hypothetical protein